MNYREEAKKIPAEDRPISPKEVSGLGNFFGIYGGEHIAATEFVIGATLVTLGVKASDIFLGLYLVLACLMGAREDYTAQAEEDRKIQEALAQIQSEEDRQTQTVHTKYPGAQKAAAFASYAVLAVFAVFTVMVLFGSVAPDTWKRVSFILSITYFVLGGAATYIKFALTEKA